MKRIRKIIAPIMRKDRGDFTLRSVPLPSGRLLSGCGFPGDRLQERNNRVPDGRVGIAFPNPGDQDVVDNPAGDSIRDNRFQAVPDFDPDLSIVGENKQDQPVLQSFPSDLPGGESPGGEILKRDVARRRGNVKKDLVPRFLFERLQPGVDVGPRPGRNESRQVGRPAVGGRRNPRRLDGGQGETAGQNKAQDGENSAPHSRAERPLHRAGPENGLSRTSRPELCPLRAGT